MRSASKLLPSSLSVLMQVSEVNVKRLLPAGRRCGRLAVKAQLRQADVLQNQRQERGFVEAPSASR